MTDLLNNVMTAKLEDLVMVNSLAGKRLETKFGELSKPEKLYDFLNYLVESKRSKVPGVYSVVAMDEMLKDINNVVDRLNEQYKFVKGDYK
jgi:hypothetical protein